jgi:hypothetical protein
MGGLLSQAGYTLTTIVSCLQLGYVRAELMVCII